MGQKLSQRQIMDQWVATENIARYQLKLSNEAGTCERKLLEALIVIEKAKLGLDPFV